MKNINKEDTNETIENNHEEILHSYRCTNSIFTLLRISILSVFIYYLYIYLNEYENIIELIVGFSFGFGFIYLIYLEINNLINRGFHITKKYLITFNGNKIPIENIMYRYHTVVEFDHIVFYNKQNFIQFCFIKDNQEFKKFISTLKVVSNNNNFIYDEINNIFKFQEKQYIKSKLIIEGTNNGK